MIIEEFYKAFADLDAERMVACYHPDIVFEDPAFGQLHGEKARNMWRMICQSQKDKGFVVEYRDLNLHGEVGSAKWDAYYVFSQTSRKVHNKITANFKLKDGLIIEHNDNFDLHNWSKQAMGLKGFLLGRTGFFKRKLQEQTNKLLHNFEERNK